jgi:hypothetical protein
VNKECKLNNIIPLDTEDYLEEDDLNKCGFYKDLNDKNIISIMVCWLDRSGSVKKMRMGSVFDLSAINTVITEEIHRLIREDINIIDMKY